jgi:N-acetylmuramoyl-L-alanine amidase
MEVPLKQGRLGIIRNLLAWFIVHPRPAKTYAWIKVKTVDAADGSTPVPGAAIDLKVLRDNEASGFKNFHRRVALVSAPNGNVSLDATRDTLAVPINWPLIFTATKDGYVPRGHMIRMDAAQAKQSNLQATLLDPIRMTKLSAAVLTGHKILLDPGHGVVYARLRGRRSQEWYLVHQVCEKIADILKTEHRVKAGDILWTRTAGFGLIDPDKVHADNRKGYAGAPEEGEVRYQVDLPNKRIAALLPTVGLHDISSLLLTMHQGPKDAAVPVSEDERNQFLADNMATIDVIVERINKGLPTGQRVRKESKKSPVRWNVATKRYVYTCETLAGEVVHDAVPVTIALTDWFALNQRALDVLADRSARWAVMREIGSAKAKSFIVEARKSLQAADAVTYMRLRTLQYLNVPAGHPYLAHGIKGWGLPVRTHFLNQEGAKCSLVLSLHANGGASDGGEVLIAKDGSAPPAQIRVAKIFLKHLDWFDLGTRKGGLEVNEAEMLASRNHIRDKYVYIESDFMDGKSSDESMPFRYQQMLTAPAIERLARQIVAGIVEFLLDQQANLDQVTYNQKAPLRGVW